MTKGIKKSPNWPPSILVMNIFRKLLGWTDEIIFIAMQLNYGNEITLKCTYFVIVANLCAWDHNDVCRFLTKFHL